MNVLMTTDAVGGVWTHALDLAGALARRGVRVTLATQGPEPSREQVREVSNIHGVAHHHVGGPLEWMPDAWTGLEEAGETLLRLAARDPPDVVHLNGYAHATLPWDAPVLLATHSCVCGWWRAVHGEQPPPEWDAYVSRVERALDAAALVVAPSHAMLAQMRAHHALPRASRVVHNGSVVRPVEAREKEPYVLAVGRVWDEAKDVPTLDAAAKGCAWPVHVVGDPVRPGGGAAPPLRHALALGRLDATRLEAAYARAGIFAHAARYEPFGLSPLEAARHGCALVLSDIPTLREVWGDAALYAAPGDARGFRASTTRLAEDPSLRQEMAQRARSRSMRYDADTMAAGYLQCYHHIRLAKPEGSARAS